MEAQWSVPDLEITQQPINYDEDDFCCVILHIRMQDMPDRCLEEAPYEVRELFKFWLFVHRIFEHRSKGETDMFLIQQENVTPCHDKDVRSQGSPGLFVLFVFTKNDFDDNLPVAAEAALAAANGFLGHKDIFVKDDWTALEKELVGFDPVMGCAIGRKKFKDRKPSPDVPSFKTIGQFDMAMHKNFLLAKDLTDVKLGKSDDDWKRRAEIFSPLYLFTESFLIRESYKELLLYANWLAKSDISQDMKPTLRSVEEAAKKLNDMGIHRREFERHVSFYKWHGYIERGNVHQGYILDLSDSIAWLVNKEMANQKKGLFIETKFYEWATNKDRIRRGLKRCPTTMENEEEPEIKRARAELISGKSCKKDSKSDFEILYPTLYLIHAGFDALTSEDEDVSSFFTRGNNSEFMLRTYNRRMEAQPVCGTARKNQFQYLEGLYETFHGGHLNTVKGKKAQPFCLRRTCDVEAHQDMMVQHLLAMVKESKIYHLGVECSEILCANIISFTTHRHKPAMVLNGHPATGKSFTTLAAGTIIRGADVCLNEHAFAEEQYSTIRSMTASNEEEYDRVSGTRFIQEWTGGDSGENRFASDTSTESTTMKNIWDSGMCKSDRCIKKDKTGKIICNRDVALNDRAFIVLANGFSACASLTDRLLVYQIPDLHKPTEYVKDQDTKDMLAAKKLPHLFAFMRFYISEGINCRSIGLNIKETNLHADLDDYEMELTFNRMDEVLKEMGYGYRILSARVRTQILYFAEVFSRWRAVVEVLGYSWKRSEPADLQSQLKIDSKELHDLSEETKMMMMEKRTVLDPSDLISAATMVLIFTDHKTEILHDICRHLLDPGCIEVVDGEVYMKINTSLNQMKSDLSQKRCSVLPQAINDCLTDQEGKKTDGGSPVVRKHSNSNTVKDSTRFTLYIHGQAAADCFCKSQVQIVQQCTMFMVEHLAKVEKLTWHLNPSQLKTTDGRMQMPVPENLIKAFHFLCHLGKEELPMYLESNLFAIPIDFGKLRHHVAQRLLMDEMCNKFQENIILETDSEGYFCVPLDTERRRLFSYNVTRVPQEQTHSAPVHQKTQSGDDRVHVSIFRPEYGAHSAIRAKVLECQLSLDRLASEGYFTISDGTDILHNETDIRMITPFLVDSENNLRVHYNLLTKLPMINGCFQEKENKVRTFVKKTLCKHMTDMSTVLVFDRETCQKTQECEDTFFFYQVPPADELPEYWGHQKVRPDVTVNRVRHATMDIWSFVPRHRYMKLAYKELIMNGTVRQLRKQVKPGLFEAVLKKLVRERAEKLASEPPCVPLKIDNPLLPYPYSMVKL